jgi:SAM-dependent methyltransferase
MSFDVAADAYTRFMGRFAIPLTDEFIALVDPQPGQRALDVGCGPGALTARLIDLLGADSVAAVEPSPSFVAAAQERFPDTDVRQSTAEELPFENDTFDLALAQLVVHFMTDAVAGLREMARVTKPGGLVAASVWDYGTNRSPLSPFWRAAIALDPTVVGESRLAGAREGELPKLFTAAGLSDVRGGELTIQVPFASVDEYWEPFELGVGPAGAYVGSLDTVERDELKRACAAELPDAPFVLESTAWVASARD